MREPADLELLPAVNSQSQQHQYFVDRDARPQRRHVGGPIADRVDIRVDEARADLKKRIDATEGLKS